MEKLREDAKGRDRRREGEKDIEEKDRRTKTEGKEKWREKGYRQWGEAEEYG
jgi:hypothetical protein